MQYSIQDFVQLIAQLRNPNGGCPWDLKQNYETMIPCLTEETYEVIEAIEKKDVPNLREELGDLLLQVVFFSQLAKEDGYFNFNDVVQAVAEKIVRRHPHVFGDAKAGDETEALSRWNEMKAKEKVQKSAETSILDNIPRTLPSLTRAEKLQKHCSKIGFDWNEVTPVFEKVQEELEEVQSEIHRTSVNQAKVEEEIGDLLFAAVNLARHLKCDPEDALRKANLKFERRCRTVEQRVQQQGKKINEMSLFELDLLWDEVKKEEKSLNLSSNYNK